VQLDTDLFAGEPREDEVPLTSSAVEVGEYAGNGTPPEEGEQPSLEDIQWHAAQVAGGERSRAAKPRATTETTRKLDGAEFVFASPLEVPALWGKAGGEVLWAPGESLMLVGPDGVGKTTLAQELMLARIGLLDELLSFPVAPAQGRALCLAMDRPAQAARSLRRMVSEDAADILRDRLAVWKGPLPVNVLAAPALLADWIEHEFEDVSDVFIDSLKDLAPKLSDDDVGSRINLARQELLARGLQVIELHHQRKEQRGQGKPKTLADVYGSRWLTAGAGSVVLLWGDAGDLVVDLVHLKQPADEVGSLRVLHDHQRGVSTLHEHTDPEAILADAPNGLTVKDGARLLFDASEPKPNEIEKTRRKFERLIETAHAERRDDPDGLARYFLREQPS
jgi:replicative DNA helicase